MTEASSRSAGWYPDPAGRFDNRYWDGNQWTSAVKRGEQVESDPGAVPGGSSDIGTAKPQSPSPDGPAAMPAAATPPQWPQGPRASGDRQTSLPLAEAQHEIVRILPNAGILIMNEQPGQVHAAVPVKGETNAAIAVVLCLICIIPGIIYLVTSAKVKNQPAILHLAPSPQGGTTITVQAEPGVRQMVIAALGTLPW
jgi:Protein of unknown function (DUF2510)